ncbi:MAG: SEC-C metal-binding domain-containing protein [Acidimicrobiia bacterium]
MTSAALAGELRSAGIDLGPEGADRVERVLDASSEFVELDGGWVGVAAQLDGTRWITTVDGDAAKGGVLPVEPDLALLGWWVMDTALTLGDSGEALEVDEDLDTDDVLIGPLGWLDAYAGADVEVRVAGTALFLAAVGEPNLPAEMVAAVRATFEQHAVFQELRDTLGNEPVDLTQMSLDDLLWEALICHRDAFTASPIPPVDVLLGAAGLVREHHLVLRVDADLGALHRWQRRNRVARLHRLEGTQVDWAELVIAMSRAVISGKADPLGPPEKAAAGAMLLAVALDDPAVCRALLGTHLEEETRPLELARFAQSIVTELPAEDGAGARWLEGRALDLAGDPQGAVAAFEGAEATGQEHALALIGLAGFRADAGDALEAVALLRRAGVDEEEEDDVPGGGDAFELFSEVVGYARHRPPAQVGRNERCPCGSGRKYKLCHLGKERHSLIDRGSWLYAKHRRYLRDHDRRIVAMLASEVRAASGRDFTFMTDLLDTPLVADIALCEGGIGESFVAERDALLPDDEAILAARWQLVERGLFEVDEAGPTYLNLRDLRTGERITVTNTNADTQTRRGDLMLGRPLPVGDTWRAYSGFVKVGALRDEILDALDHPDPFDIAELIGRCLAAPRMQNTDGEPLQFHELVWELTDPEAARRALEAHSDLTEDDGGYVLIRDSANQPRTVILALTITGDLLRGEVNSDRRADEIIALVRSSIPTAELVDHDIRDVDEALEAHRATGAPRAPNLLDDPDMADVREQISTELERRWLDDHIPALGGRTPREAALDPIGRHELERLLDSFGDGPDLMDVARLRKALDL